MIKKIKCPCCGKEVYKIVDGGVLQYLDSLHVTHRHGYLDVHTCKVK